MIKINSVDLKGFKLVLTDGKTQYPVAVLDDVIPAETTDKEGKKTEYAKVGLHRHLVAGNTFQGVEIAELSQGRVLMLRGAIYSRIKSVKGNNAVGVIG